MIEVEGGPEKTYRGSEKKSTMRGGGLLNGTALNKSLEFSSRQLFTL